MYITVKTIARRAVKPTVLLLWILVMELQVKHGKGGASSCKDVSKVCKSQLKQLSASKCQSG